MSDVVFEQLMRISPNTIENLNIYPCDITLQDGSRLDRVAVAERRFWKPLWGHILRDPNNKTIDAIEIVEVRESEWRIPKEHADRLYSAGESGMGYTFFVAEFSDGLRQAYLGGNALDFIHCPEGRTPNDIVEVHPHAGRMASDPISLPEFLWCPYHRPKTSHADP